MTNKTTKRLSKMALALIIALTYLGCKEKPPMQEYPGLLGLSFRVFHHDTTGLQQMFPFQDGHGLVSGYDVDSISLLSNSQQTLFLDRQWNGQIKEWYFHLSEYDYSDGTYGGRDTVEREQRMFLYFNSSEIDTIQIFYKYKLNPNPTSTGEDPATVYIKDYSKLYINHNWVLTDTEMVTYFEAIK